MATQTATNESTPKSLDERLLELRSGRRLRKIVSSIESFLQSQVGKFELALEQCQAAVENDQVIQRVLANFEAEKAQWERERQAEVERLHAANEKLIAGWQELEDERRKWLDEAKLVPINRG